MECTYTYELIKQAFESDKRFLIIYGSSGSSKSHSMYQTILLNFVNEKQNDYLILRKIGNTIYNSVYQGVKNIAQNEPGLNAIYDFYKSPLEIHNKRTGRRIIFTGVDDPEKLKSIVNIRIAILEEATEFTKDDFLEINRRLRGVEHVKIILIFNPISHTHWIKKHFFDNEIVRRECDIVHCIYQYNNFMTDSDIKQLEDLKYIDENDYKIYAKGEWGILTERLIFRNWSTIEAIPHTAKQIPSGMDFGFSPDPTTLIDFYIEGQNLYIDERIYKRNLVNIDLGTGFSIIEELKAIGFDKSQLIIADSAEPKSIMEIRLSGYNILAVQKPGIFDSLKLMKSYNIFITSRSKNVITEFENYMHKIDKDGNIIPDPIDDFNHSIDPCRYVLSQKNRLW
jgi:phage terminase large subunit